MGLFDSIKGAVESLAGSLSSSALPGMIEKAYPGGLNGLLQQLSSSGYGAQVSSWLGHGPNDPITTEDLRSALSNEQVKAMAQRFGIPADQVLDTLARALPPAVDQHSPDGTLRPPANEIPQS